MSDINQPQPTMCSMCGGTMGKCESCRKNVDAIFEVFNRPGSAITRRAEIEQIVSTAVSEATGLPGN